MDRVLVSGAVLYRQPSLQDPDPCHTRHWHHDGGRAFQADEQTCAKQSGQCVAKACSSSLLGRRARELNVVQSEVESCHSR